MVKIDETDFDDFEQFVELFIFELFNFHNFVQFSPEDLLPIFTQINSRYVTFYMTLLFNFMFLSTQTSNPADNLPHEIKISTLTFNTISTTILLFGPIFIILDRLDILFILTRVIIQISIWRLIIIWAISTVDLLWQILGM
mgnify:CR=1 FL=1